MPPIQGLPKASQSRVTVTHTRCSPRAGERAGIVLTCNLTHVELRRLQHRPQLVQRAAISRCRLLLRLQSLGSKAGGPGGAAARRRLPQAPPDSPMDERSGCEPGWGLEAARRSDTACGRAERHCSAAMGQLGGGERRRARCRAAATPAPACARHPPTPAHPGRLVCSRSPTRRKGGLHQRLEGRLEPRAQGRCPATRSNGPRGAVTTAGAATTPACPTRAAHLLGALAALAQAAEGLWRKSEWVWQAGRPRVVTGGSAQRCAHRCAAQLWSWLLRRLS